ncbi:hypothetical protein MA16_Dca022140 [Dendrobium catenatum]|uniref:Uncharacterized protein n=1 Tax=Dendrobium catenatum TaxID=906689 RepID=A0A2I0XG79_9ASPA|nr:hypothetical protein MA16_Dca022140 [Dendrobium catenatum]
MAERGSGAGSRGSSGFLELQRAVRIGGGGLVRLGAGDKSVGGGWEDFRTACGRWLGELGVFLPVLFEQRVKGDGEERGSRTAGEKEKRVVRPLIVRIGGGSLCVR